MPRDGSNVYAPPAGTLATSGTAIESAKYNAFVNDLTTDANTARPVVAGGTGATTAANARTNLGLAIGTNVQAYDAGLQSISGLTTAADKGIYTTAADTYATFDLTAAGRALLDDANAAAQRTTLGLGALATAANITTSEIAAATLVTAADTVASNDNDTTIPTTAAVIDYVPVALNASGSAPIYACRAWGNFNGTGTPAFRASGNCSSITDNGTGDYTITMTTALPDANYTILACGNSGNDDSAGSRNDWYNARPLTSSTFRIYVYDQAGTATDSAVIMFSVFR